MKLARNATVEKRASGHQEDEIRGPRMYYVATPKLEEAGINENEATRKMWLHPKPMAEN
jgi:hypothetical protein